PSSLKMRNGEGKVLLKKTMEPHLPNDVLYRLKMGFAVPLAKWFRGPLRQRVRAQLSEGPLADSGWFDLKAVERLIEQHESGARDHSTPLWTLLMYDAFLRNVAGGSSKQTGERQAMAA